MTKFSVVQSITGVSEYSRLIFEMARKADSAEMLEKELSMELAGAGLQAIMSAAQSGNYPLSLDRLQ